jgi:hypothetical protein
MDYKNLTHLIEAYSAVYDEELKSELVSEDQDLSFIDDLSDNELTQIMEEILSEEEVTLQECLDVFDAELLSEARVDMAARAAARKQYMAASEKSAKEARGRAASAEATAKREKSAERERVGRKHAMKRLQVAATRAGKNLADKAKSAGQKAKTLGAGAASAAAGGAVEAGRKVTGKLKSAKEKIKGLVKSGRKAVAGGLRGLASRVEPKETGEKSTPVSTSASPQAKTKTVTVSRRSAAAAKLAKAAAGSGPSGSTQQGQPAGTFKSKKSREQARKREARLTAAESLNLLDLVVADLINEGYAYDIDDAYDLIENMDSEQTYNIVESYIEEETVDVYDIVLEHLVVEGYADTLEQAEAIMVNMSEEWRDEIIDEAQIMSVSGKGGLKHMINPNIVRAQNAAARERQGRQEREKQAKNNANAERIAQVRKASIQRLNAKPGADSGDYDSGYHGDDDTSGGKRHYSLSRTNRSDRKRRESGR